VVNSDGQRSSTEPVGTVPRLWSTPVERRGVLGRAGHEPGGDATVSGVSRGRGAAGDTGFHGSDRSRSGRTNGAVIAAWAAAAILLSLVALTILIGCEPVTIQSRPKKSPTDEPQPTPAPDGNCPDGRCPYEAGPIQRLERALRHANYSGGSCAHAAMQDVLVAQGMAWTARLWRQKYRGGAGVSTLRTICEALDLRYAYTTTGEVEFLEWCSRTRRPACIFYNRSTTSPYAAHAITFIGFDRGTAILLDNNDPRREHATPKDQFIRQWNTCGRNYGYHGGVAFTVVYTPVGPLPGFSVHGSHSVGGFHYDPSRSPTPDDPRVRARRRAAGEPRGPAARAERQRQSGEAIIAMKTTENSQTDLPVTYCDWQDVDARLVLVDREGRKLYGVTPGAKIVAGFLRRAEQVRDPVDATHLLVDVLDRDGQYEDWRAKYPGAAIVTLFDCTREDHERGHLVMPWEEEPPSTSIPLSGRLHPEEWEAIERLAQCHSLLSKLDGLDFERFDTGIQQLQEMVFSLPVKRGLTTEV